MFAAVFLIFNYKIITRYLEHDEAVWADEVSVILFIWIIFWANAFLVRDKEQITFDLVYRPMPDRVKRVMTLARLVLVGGIFLCGTAGLDRLPHVPVARAHAGARVAPRLRLFDSSAFFLPPWSCARPASIVKLVGPNWRSNI